MSLLTIVQDAARSLALDVPTTAQASTDSAVRSLIAFANETGREAARRVPWGALSTNGSVLVTAALTPTTLASDFYALSSPAVVRTASGVPLRGGLSDAEWSILSPSEAPPRFFRQRGRHLEVWPVPNGGATINYRYQSRNWTSAGTDALTADAQSALIDERLITMGAVWRYLRFSGQPYQDQMAEWEAMLNDMGAADAQARTP